jgi:hypothetical protein
MTSLFQLDEELLTCSVDCFGYTKYECLCFILEQETKLVAVQSGLKRMAAEAASKEKNLRFREHAVIHSEKDLQVILLPPLTEDLNFHSFSRFIILCCFVFWPGLIRCEIRNSRC